MEILRFIAKRISKNTYVNIMDQYRPLYKASKYDEINRCITGAEYEAAVKAARCLGLDRGF